MPSRRRSPPENTLNPELCQDFVISSISSSGTLTALIAAGSAWWIDSSASITSAAIEAVSAIGDIVDGDLVADPNGRHPVLAAAGQHHPELVVGDVAGAHRLLVAGSRPSP